MLRTVLFRSIRPALRLAGHTRLLPAVSYNFSTKVVDEIEGCLNSEQLLVLNEMFGKIDKLESELTLLREKVDQMKPIGVDAPDGESDAELADDLHVVEDMIDGAAAHEDATLVNKKHQLQDDVKQFHARDPEHDW